MAVQSDGEPQGTLKATNLEWTSGVSLHGKPFVHLTIMDESGVTPIQLTPDEARNFAKQGFEVAEAAEMDAVVFQFMWNMFGDDLPDEEKNQIAAKILMDFRNLRDELQAKRDGA